MASFPREKGTYHRVVFRKTYNTPDGKVQREKAFYFKKSDYTRTQVKEWKIRKEMEFKGGDWIPWDDPGIPEENGISLEQVSEAYLAKAKKIYAKSTYDIRKTYIHNFCREIGPKRSLKSIRIDQVNQWINDPGIKFPTRKNRKKAVSLLFGFTQKQYGFHPGELEVIAKQAEKQHYYSKQYKSFITEEQLEQIVAPLPKDLQDFYRLAFYSTRRRGDLLAIRSRWISKDEPMLTLGEKGGYLPKSQIIEYVPLIDPAWKILLRRAEGRDRIFDFTPDYVTKHFQKALNAAIPKLKGLVSLHNLRDSGIMHLLYEEEIELKHLMNMTGHRDIRSLQIYTHPNARRTLAELQK